MKFPKGNLSKNEINTQSELWKNNFSNGDNINSLEKELFNSNNFVLNNEIESNSEKNKIFIGNKFKLKKVPVAKKLILSDKNEDSSIPAKKEKLSNLSNFLRKNICLIFLDFNNLIPGKNDVQILSGEIITLKGEISKINKKILRLDGEVSGIKKDILGIKGEISGIKGEISGIKGEISGMNSKYDIMMDLLKKMNASIDKLQKEKNANTNNNIK